MKQLTRSALLSALLLLAANPAQAHPGHDLFSSGLPHAITNPNHMIALAFTGGVLFALGFAVKRAGARRGLQFAGVTMALAAACWRMAA